MSVTPPLSLRDVRVETLASSVERGRDSEAIFHWPLGMALTPQGDLLVANYLGHNIRRIDSKGTVTTFAGTGHQGFHQGPSETASFSGPSSIALTPRGDLLVTDVLNNCLRRVTKDGMVSIFAGTGQQGFRNGPKEQATFFYPFGMALTALGHILVLDKGNHSIRMIHGETNVVSTYAGCGQAGCKDGLKERAMFSTPYGLCLVPEQPKQSSIMRASVGSDTLSLSSSLSRHNSQQQPCPELYVADSGNHRICHIDNAGNVKTAAGVPGVSGFSDGSTATAKFNGPRSILLTPHGDLLVSDQGNQRIRIIETNGLVSTFAGCDRPGCLDGPRGIASFSSPSELCLTPSGILYISDFTNNKIRCIKCPMWDMTNTPATRRADQFSLEPLLDESCPESLSDLSLSLAKTSYTSSRGGIVVSQRSSSPQKSLTESFSSSDSPAASAVGLAFSNTWKLHKAVILSRSPRLLYEETIVKLARASLSAEAISAFVHYLYCDELPDLSITHLCDLDCILSLCGLQQLSEHVQSLICSELDEIAIGSDENTIVVAYIELLGHIARNCELGSASNAESESSLMRTSFRPSASSSSLAIVYEPSASIGKGHYLLVDTIMERLRSLRTFVSIHMKLLYDLLKSTEDLLVRVLAKLVGEETLQSPVTTCTYSSMARHPNACDHFGLLPDQLYALFLRQVAKGLSYGHSTKSSDVSSSPESRKSPRTAHHSQISSSLDSASQSVPSPPAGTLFASLDTQEVEDDSIVAVAAAAAAGGGNNSRSGGLRGSPSLAKLLESSTQLLDSPASEKLFDRRALGSVEAEPDFELLVRGRRLPCHKAILYGRWPYFARAMKVGGFEFQSNTMELPEDTFSAPLMLAILQYFYSNHVLGITSEEDCLQVLDHAVLFGFADSDNEPLPGFEILMSHCRKPLAKPLNAANCVSVLKSVLKYGNAHQQYKVRSYVARVLPEIMNDDKLAQELEALGPAETTRILFEQFGRQVSSPLRPRPESLSHSPMSSTFANMSISGP